MFATPISVLLVEQAERVVTVGVVVMVPMGVGP
jgi:hypothetical protein